MTVSSQVGSKGLIRSMLVIGSAQTANILISIVRMKVLALLLGPAGLGLLSIYSTLQSMVAGTAGLGIASSGVREIAGARGEEATLSRVRHVLFAAHLVQGALAMLAVWLLREQISVWLFGNTTRADEVGLISVAVLLGLLAAAQTALLQGLRQIGALGLVTVISAIAASAVGLGAVWGWGEEGLIWYVLVQPLSTVLVAVYFTRRLPITPLSRLTLLDIWQVWKPMARLGGAFMLGGLATAATLLLVRSRITQELGLEAAGHFAAAWGITMTYVGFLLGAMGADYYPRLTEVIRDRPAAIRLMNDQVQLSLAVGGPVLLLLIGWAPWAIHVLYSEEFGSAVTLLQWQTVGNVFKLASWALGFSIVAAARAKTYFFMELSFNIVFLALVLMLLPSFGLPITAIAFFLGYIAYFAAAYLLVRRIHSFLWQSLSLYLLGLHVGLAMALLGLALTAPVAAALAAPLLSLATALFGLRVVLTKVGRAGRFADRLSRFYAAVGWPIRETA